MTGPKFSEVLRAYAKGLTAPWDRQYQAGQVVVSVSTAEMQIAESRARSARSAFEELANLYETYEAVK